MTNDTVFLRATPLFPRLYRPRPSIDEVWRGNLDKQVADRRLGLEHTVHLSPPADADDAHKYSRDQSAVECLEIKAAVGDTSCPRLRITLIGIARNLAQRTPPSKLAPLPSPLPPAKLLVTTPLL